MPARSEVPAASIGRTGWVGTLKYLIPGSERHLPWPPEVSIMTAGVGISDLD